MEIKLRRRLKEQLMRKTIFRMKRRRRKKMKKKVLRNKGQQMMELKK